MMQKNDEEHMMGFTIRCGSGGDGDDVIVTDEDARKLASKCDYFRNVFAHGTLESLERILVKPDWTASTAKKLVELITTGKTTVRDEATFARLSDATQQILLSTTNLIPSFVKGGPILQDKRMDDATLLKFFSLTAPPTRSDLCLHIPEQSINCDLWMKLLNNGISIDKHEQPGFEVSVNSDSGPATRPGLGALLESFSFGFVGPNDCKVWAHSSNSSIGFLLRQLCEALHESRDQGSDYKMFTSEAYSLRIPVDLLFLCDHACERLVRGTGAKVYFHKGNSLGYYLDGSNDRCPTISGSFEQIRDALNLIPSEMIPTYSNRLSSSPTECQRCSLRVCAPSSQTLDRLVKAVRSCHDNPDTLGVDVKSKAFFAVKTVHDMKIILHSLTGGGDLSSSSGSMADKTVHLFSLTYPKGVF